MEATDRDLVGSLHVKIRYTLLTGLDMFAINPATGVITTVTNTLDREVSTGSIAFMITHITSSKRVVLPFPRIILS